MALVWRRFAETFDGAYVEGRYEDAEGDPQQNIVTRAAWANPTARPVRVWVYKGADVIVDQTMSPDQARQEANVPVGRRFSWEDETLRVNLG